MTALDLDRLERIARAARGDGVAVVLWYDPVEVAGDMPTAEARARAILDRMEIPGHFSAGELVELANLVADLDRARRRIAELEAQLSQVEAIADIAVTDIVRAALRKHAPAPGATPEEGNDV